MKVSLIEYKEGKDFNDALSEAICLSKAKLKFSVVCNGIGELLAHELRKRGVHFTALWKSVNGKVTAREY